MSMDDYDITPIGYTTWRNQNISFGIKDKDRLGHIYCIGKTGMGKSTLLQKMALSDIIKGKGCGIIDPHGDVAKYLLERIPEDRKKDVVYIHPGDKNNSITFNPLHAVHTEFHSLVASGLLSTFKKIWGEFWGPRLEHVLRHSLLTLLNYPKATLLQIQPLLTDTIFRHQVLEYVKDDYLLDFWRLEFDRYTPSFKQEVISPILNKMGVFNANHPIRKLFGAETASFRMSRVLEDEKILIVNLSKGEIGQEATSIIGSIIVSSIQLSALYRAKQALEARKPFYLYLDEAHIFISDSISEILSESRKYGLSLFIAHQYLDQMDEKIQKSIFGNIGSIVCFRTSSKDAITISQNANSEINILDIVQLGRFEVYLKMQIDGINNSFFSARI